MNKKSLLFIVILFSYIAAVLPQDNKSGSVIYTETVKLEIKLEGEMAAMMKDLPKEKKSEKILWFSPDASLYDEYREEGEKEMSGGIWHTDGANVKIMVQSPENIVFTDFTNKEIIEQKEFMTRMFLIKGDMPEKEWKITGKQQMILDYPCMEANSTDTSGIVTRIWFTPSIELPAGPGQYCNMPGLVLKVDIDNGKRILEARKINFDEPDKELFEKPKKGKKVSRDEYNLIVAEKMKEMGEEKGNKETGTIVVKIRK